MHFLLFGAEGSVNVKFQVFGNGIQVCYVLMGFLSTRFFHC